MEQIFQMVIDAAAALAKTRHAGQVDKAGVDYFSGHLSTVAGLGETWRETVLGYLHDVAEDTGLAEEDSIAVLRSQTPPGGITDAEWDELTKNLRLLNSRTAPDREAYIRRYRGHPLAIRVKLHDLRNNMDLTRLPEIDEKALNRHARYEKEAALLRSWLTD